MIGHNISYRKNIFNEIHKLQNLFISIENTQLTGNGFTGRNCKVRYTVLSDFFFQRNIIKQNIIQNYSFKYLT